MGEGLFGKIFGKGKKTESNSVAGSVVEAVATRALGGELDKPMTLKFQKEGPLSEAENESKICIEDNLIYKLVNQCTGGELDKKLQGTKNAFGVTNSLTISKDTLLKIREVLKDDDLAKALQMSGSVAQVASLGVLVVAAGMLKKANDQLSEMNASVSRIAAFQIAEYASKVNTLLSYIQTETEFQSETLKHKDLRNCKLNSFETQQLTCVQLLNQANISITGAMDSDLKSFKNYVDITTNIEKWYQYQQILIVVLRQISELILTCNLGVTTKGHCYSEYNKILPKILEVRKVLRDWHLKNMGYFSVDLKEKKYQRTGTVFDAAKRIPIGNIVNKIRENTISDDMIGFIEHQTNENYDELAAASGNQFEQDVKLVVENGKLYCVTCVN